MTPTSWAATKRKSTNGNGNRMAHATLDEHDHTAKNLAKINRQVGEVERLLNVCTTIIDAQNHVVLQIDEKTKRAAVTINHAIDFVHARNENNYAQLRKRMTCAGALTIAAAAILLLLP
jgi:t-SNARE complex subunit (syntaxin)